MSGIDSRHPLPRAFKESAGAAAVSAGVSVLGGGSLAGNALNSASGVWSALETLLTAGGSPSASLSGPSAVASLKLLCESFSSQTSEGHGVSSVQLESSSSLDLSRSMGSPMSSLVEVTV